MRDRIVIWVGVAALLASFFSVRAEAQTPAPEQNLAKAAANAGTPEGLTALLGSLFAAVKAGDKEKAAAIYEGLAIPDHKQWFAKTFGEPEGSWMDDAYNRAGAHSLDGLKTQVQLALQGGKSESSLRIFRKPDDVSVDLIKSVLAAMKTPTALYHADYVSGPDDPSPVFLGNFVYVNGGFRFLDHGPMWAMTAPQGPRAMRIRLGGSVAKARLVYRVDPVYPELARQNGIQGTVTLRVVLAKDGTVRDIQVVSGDGALQAAAVDAVKQWRYSPTLLNGQAVEVDTAVDVVFTLAPSGKAGSQ